MSGKKKLYIKKPFESDGSGSDVSANLYKSMLMSPAWCSLTPKQQQLYTYCKLQYYAERQKPKTIKHPDGDERLFTMNRAKYVKLYGLYSDGNRAAFYRDMGELKAKGFIVCEESGKSARDKSVFKFSSEWQRYGAAEGKV